MEVIIDSYFKRINAACELYDIQEQHPLFHSRLTFYLDKLLECMAKKERLNDDLVAHALLETHTILSIDEDIDGLGMEKMMNIWEEALGIEYGVDYLFNY